MSTKLKVSTVTKRLKASSILGTFYKPWALAFSIFAAASDLISKIIGKKLSDSPVAADALSKAVSKAIEDSPIAIDEASLQYGKHANASYSQGYI